jgi:hypothetical protein
MPVVSITMIVILERDAIRLLVHPNVSNSTVEARGLGAVKMDFVQKGIPVKTRYVWLVQTVVANVYGSKMTHDIVGNVTVLLAKGCVVKMVSLYVMNLPKPSALKRPRAA